MGSMHTGLEDRASNYPKLAAFFAERAAGGVGLIITGGISPNYRGGTTPWAGFLKYSWQVKRHQLITEAVHNHDGKICMQLLHAGRYAYNPLCQAPSRIKSPISKFTPFAMSNRQINNTINDYANSASLAQRAGYDGVEIMGSEGYLINQFISLRTNKRTDKWGGNYQNRCRFALEICRSIREKCGDNYIIIFRLSLLDLIDDGSTFEEVIELAKELEKTGVNIINTGIGWHEARIPTIVSSVPHGAFSWVTARLKEHVTVPLIASNRLNLPDQAETIIKKGQADMVSMARPFLADAHFYNKAVQGKQHSINVCIACNQACLDHVFKNKRATCLVNPRACFETDLNLDTQNSNNGSVLVVGAGPAGLSCASEAQKFGYKVTLVEAKDHVGGQFSLAEKIPGKSDFIHTITYFENLFLECGGKLKLDTQLSVENILEKNWDHIVIATGVKPRRPKIAGINHTMVCSYAQVLRGDVALKERIAIIGAGGIGFDMAEFVIKKGKNEGVSEYLKEWNIDHDLKSPGGVLSKQENNTVPESTIYMLQRSQGKQGRGLGKTTGWIHRLEVKKAGVKQMSGCEYLKIDDTGLHIRQDEKEQVLEVDQIIYCSGQESVNRLSTSLSLNKVNHHVIGGALKAGELDAKSAIKEGFLLAHTL